MTFVWNTSLEPEPLGNWHSYCHIIISSNNSSSIAEARGVVAAAATVWCCAIYCVVVVMIYSVSQKKIPPLRFSEIFPKWLGIFNQFFTHLLCDYFYTRAQIFIQISPTLTKLCRTKRDHLAKFYVSLEL